MSNLVPCEPHEIDQILQPPVRYHRGVGVACGARRTWERGHLGKLLHWQNPTPVWCGKHRVFLEMLSGAWFCSWTVGKEDHATWTYLFLGFFEVCISSNLVVICFVSISYCRDFDWCLAPRNKSTTLANKTSEFWTFGLQAQYLTWVC